MNDNTHCLSNMEENDQQHSGQGLPAPVCSRRTNIPKAKFQIGDEVDVKIVEAGAPPSFRATVVGILLRRDPWSPCLEYTVMEESGAMSDGYTEEWLSPANNELSRRPE